MFTQTSRPDSLAVLALEEIDDPLEEDDRVRGADERAADVEAFAENDVVLTNLKRLHLGRVAFELAAAFDEPRTKELAERLRAVLAL